MAKPDHRDSYRPNAGEIPTQPGVYRFSDSNGRALYIGKAKNLRSRLSNYFGPLEALNRRIQRMLLTAVRVDWTVVASDSEALVLEHTWINELEPPFNVQFRDDKSYPYLAVTLQSEAPRLIMTRNTSIRGARYFGPFPKAWAVKEMKDLLQQAFPIRTCNDATYKRALASAVPCLASQIGQCAGPCSLHISLADHRLQVERLVEFLSGNDVSMVTRLKSEMQDASVAQNYERAAMLRDQLTAVQHILEKNGVVLRNSVDADVFGLVVDDLAAAAHQFIIRGGRIRGERSWIVDIEIDSSPELLLAEVIQSAYDESASSITTANATLAGRNTVALPREILTPFQPDDVELLESVLAKTARRKVRIYAPERGEKLQIVGQATRNAGEHLMRYKLRRAADIVSRTDALAELQRELDLEQVPLHIECIDISHLSGTDVVGALVTFEDALPAKSGYRHYRVEHTSDDTESIYQVVQRRFKHSAELSRAEASSSTARVFPELLIIDGGQPQVSAAQRALDSVGVSGVAVCGIAKRLEELWLPNKAFPVILPRNSEALFLVQRIRDEAHRFAISHQRKRRSHSLQSTLGDIPGLGEKRVASLLRKFHSLKRIREASVEELASTPGISETLAQHILAQLNQAESPEILGVSR